MDTISRFDGGQIALETPIRRAAAESPSRFDGGHKKFDILPKDAAAESLLTAGEAITALTPTGALSPPPVRKKRKSATTSLQTPTHAPPTSSTPSPREARHRVTPTAGVPSPAILMVSCLSIQQAHRRRQDLIEAHKSLVLRIGAIERRMGRGTQPENESDEAWKQRGAAFDEADVERATAEIRAAAEQLRAFLRDATRELERAAQQLPAYDAFVKGVCGFGAAGLGMIVGEAGDLAAYANPGKLWKRFGLAPVMGRAPSTWRSKGGLSADDWTAVGYSPKRRSIMFQIGDSLLKKQNSYRELYLARKAVEAEKAPDGTKMLWHRRAQRYAEKRLLRDLWRAWRGHSCGDTHYATSPPPAALSEVTP
jgi:hypothetical protein